jgi:2-methylcitrate dehydratase PrpD
MSGLTRQLGQFIADLSPNHLPEEAVRIARMGFTDAIGTMIAGRHEDSVRILTEVLAPAAGSATLTFGDRKGPAPEVAWINGTAAPGDPGGGRASWLLRHRDDHRLYRGLRDLGRAVPP